MSKASKHEARLKVMASSYAIGGRVERADVEAIRWLLAAYERQGEWIAKAREIFPEGGSDDFVFPDKQGFPDGKWRIDWGSNTYPTKAAAVDALIGISLNEKGGVE